MNQVTPFFFNGDKVRLVLKGDFPWFVAKDVCEVLEIVEHRQSTRNLDEDEKGVFTIHTLGGPQEMIIINESGLYSLIFRSRKEEARRFRRWVTHEVLPAIRRNGRYVSAAIPENAPLYLRPALRDRAMNYAVQAARISGGTEADIDRLFVKYCAMLGPGRSQEGTIGPDPFGVRRFLDERCELDQELHETNDDLFAAYNRFRSEFGAPRAGREAFFKELYALTGAAPYRPRRGASRKRCVKGVGLNC